MGRVNATPHADPDDVMLDMNSELSLAEMPVFFPRDATDWQGVDYVLIQPQPPVGRAVIVDLRADTWELYQYPRTMPVMEEGAVTTYLVVPEALSMRQVQTRVNPWSTSIDLHIVMALDCYQWIVNRVTLPDTYRSAILEQQHRDLVPPRGGAEFLYPIPVHIPVPEGRKLIFTMFAHDPFEVKAYYIKRDTRIWHLMDHLEGEHHAWGRLRISTMLFPVHVTARVWNLAGGVLILHFLDREQQPGYHTFFNIEWYANERWAAATESQGEWPPRGGTRSRQTVDQRAQMQVWALDRIQEFYPQLPTATANFLLRAEARTASSILNSRSGIQVIEVIEAALRRAGLRRKWFLHSSAAEMSVDSQTMDQRATAASSSGQDQVVILLLSLQNQVAGQWQAINALSNSVVQMRDRIAAAQQDDQTAVADGEGTLRHSREDDREHIQRAVQQNEEGEEDPATQDYDMQQATLQPQNAEMAEDREESQGHNENDVIQTNAVTGPPGLRQPMHEEDGSPSQQQHEVTAQDEDMHERQSLSPTPVYSQPNLEEEVVQVSDSDHNDEHPDQPQGEPTAPSARVSIEENESVQPSQAHTTATEHEMPESPSEAGPPQGQQPHSHTVPDSTLYARLGARAQRSREGPQAGALRPFRH